MRLTVGFFVMPTATKRLPRANVRRANDPFPKDRYVRVKDVPIFAEHETTARNGRKLKFTKRELERVADRCNRRIKETGDYAMLTLGHTPEPGSGLPSPEVIGFVGPYRMGTLGEPGQRQRYAILADFWVMRKTGTSSRSIRGDPWNSGWKTTWANPSSIPSPAWAPNPAAWTWGSSPAPRARTARR